MRNLLKNKFTISRSRLNSSAFNAMLTLKGQRPMFKHLLRVVYALGGSMKASWVIQIKSFLNKLALLQKHGGFPMVVKYLKVCSIVLQQRVSNHRTKDLTSLGVRISRTKDGLPRVIPPFARRLIRSGNRIYIRFWLTMFSLYRDIFYPGSLKLSTITSPRSTSSSFDKGLVPFIKSFTDLFWKDFKREVLVDSGSSLFAILTSAPQAVLKESRYSTEPKVVIASLALLLRPENENLFNALLEIYRITQNTSAIDLLYRLTQNVKDKLILTRVKSKYLGQLSIKEEAAGKVRVFAMVDCWTQWALKSLHKHLFKILSRISMDGTFDQTAPLNRIPWGQVPVYSFDLSAATDRLPISIQKMILAEVFGQSFSDSWSTLLVSREYATPRTFGSSKVPIGIPDSVTYSVGQPMGAYSSWAMLAITHHFLVQVSAWGSGVTAKSMLFSEYAVLGDDIVIWNKTVAYRYLRIMRQLGVDINLDKSILSPSGAGLEFAKRTIVKGIDVSPIPFKEQTAAHWNSLSAIQFADKFSLTPLQLLRFLGYGYKVDPTKDITLNRVINLVRSIPSDFTSLSKVFSLHREYFDKKWDYPLWMVRWSLVSLVETEIKRLEKRYTELYSAFSQHSISSWVESIGPWATQESIAYQAILETYTEKTYEVLDYGKQSCKLLNQQLSFLYEFYRNPISRETPEALLEAGPYGYRLDPSLPSNSIVFIALRKIFLLEDELSKLQMVPYLQKFNPDSSSSVTYREKKQIILK